MRRLRRIPFPPLLRIAALAGLLPAVAMPMAASAEEYYRDFRSDGFDNRALKPFGRGATSLVKETPEGIVISMPGRSEVKLLGLAPRFKVRGDFEITVSYKVLAWTRAKKGSGIGPSLYVAASGPAKAAAEMGRLHGARRDIVSTFSAVNVDGERRKSARRFPAESTAGRLRLRRRGTRLTFEHSEAAAGAPFRVLAETEFGVDELRLVRIAVKQVAPPASARVAIQSLRIRADVLPHRPSASAPTAKLYRPTYSDPPPEKTPWPVAWLAAGVAALVLVVAIWSVRRRRRA